jgi:hypothetical protein
MKASVRKNPELSFGIPDLRSLESTYQAHCVVSVTHTKIMWMFIVRSQELMRAAQHPPYDGYIK